jgi:hypothetical protein
LSIIAELKTSILDHERQLQYLRFRASGHDPNLTADLTESKSGRRAQFSKPISVPPVSPSNSPTEVEFPVKDAKPVEGSISDLTRTPAGNVPEERIVTIPSKSVNDNPKSAIRNVADLTALLFG